MDAAVESIPAPHPVKRCLLFGLRRAIPALGILLTVLTIVFVVFSVLPSDPVRNALGVNASEGAVTALRHELGYDRPLVERYVQFITDVARLDFGRSLHSRRQVRPMVFEALFITLRIGVLALLLSMLISLGLTALAQLTNRTIERGVVFTCRLLTSVPSLVMAITAGVLLLWFLGGFADAGLRATAGAVAAIAVYPTFSLTEIGVVASSRVQQASFVLAARSYGMSELAVFSRCIIPTVVTSWLGHVSNLAAMILVSSAVFEVVFSLPGLGDLLARSVIRNDLPVVQGVSVVIVVGFLAIDALFNQVLLPRFSVYSGGSA